MKKDRADMPEQDEASGDGKEEIALRLKNIEKALESVSQLESFNDILKNLAMKIENIEERQLEIEKSIDDKFCEPEEEKRCKKEFESCNDIVVEDIE